MYRKAITVTLIIFLAKDVFAQSRATVREKDGKFSIAVQNQLLEIDPAVGGRITSLKFEGKDFLTGKDVNDFNWGSTFWNSPQSDWNWPPSSELDNKPYSAKVEADELIMTSQPDPKTGLVVIKKFSGDTKGSCYILQYIIENRSLKPQKVAPWEVTRVRPNGLAFFPIGKGQRRGGLLPLTLEKDGISWFTYKQEKLPVKGDRQLYADGSEGWLAEVNDNIILVKKFPDIPLEKNAPKEGEVELFASPVAPNKTYVEIEHQGAYEELQPGDSSLWEVRWFLRKLPKSVKPVAGNRAIATYARKIVQ